MDYMRDTEDDGYFKIFKYIFMRLFMLVSTNRHFLKNNEKDNSMVNFSSLWYILFKDVNEEVTPDLWQEAAWLVISSYFDEKGAVFTCVFLGTIQFFVQKTALNVVYNFKIIIIVWTISLPVTNLVFKLSASVN